MAITVRQYRFDAQGVCQIEREEQVRSNRAAESRINRWCREAGRTNDRDPLAHTPDQLAWADTEYGQQASLDWEACGEPNTLLWETEQGLD